ncbi:MAG: GTPase ObgE [Caldilineales bacterium]|nr:GTPase ObgE [Caldilineales bacterium]
MFADEAKIYVKAGDGGNGIVAFRREKFVPRGGPAGGNGGKGGDVYLVASPHHNTLGHFRLGVHFKAGRGEHGGGSNKQGAQGADVEVPVPAGAVVRDADTGEWLGELLAAGDQLLVAHGGRGGRGNAVFKSPTHQAPKWAENGEPGEERWLHLELKLIADIGIVGVPNAGKSTLLAALTRARPKIADYPFTTLEPNLGVALVGDNRTGVEIVLADIPGLIEGAHTGAGLGLSFLRHVERTQLLIHVLNGLSPDPLGDFEAINQELELFNPHLADKPQLVAFNKMDVPEVRERWLQIRAALQRQAAEVFAISAATGENVQPLIQRAAALLSELPPPAPAAEILPLLAPLSEDAFTIEREDGAWIVGGKRIERVAAMTNWNYYEAIARFQRILEAMGIRQALAQAGVREGDTVFIGDVELEWSDDYRFDR